MTTQVKFFMGTQDSLGLTGLELTINTWLAERQSPPAGFTLAGVAMSAVGANSIAVSVWYKAPPAGLTLGRPIKPSVGQRKRESDDFVKGR